MFLHYFRTTADGRVLMGSGSGPIGFRGRVDGRFTSDDATAARAEHGLRRLLPGLADARIERAWGGPIDVSADHLPFFGTVKGKRIHYGARLLRATASARRGSAVRSSRRSCCRATTSGQRCHLPHAGWPRCRPSRSSISAARSYGPRSSRASALTRKTGDRRCPLVWALLCRGCSEWRSGRARRLRCRGCS